MGEAWGGLPGGGNARTRGKRDRHKGQVRKDKPLFKKCDSEETFSLVQERTTRLLNGGGNLWAALTSGCGGGVYPRLLPWFCPVPVQEAEGPRVVGLVHLHVVRLALILSFQAEVVEEQFDAMSSRHRDMPGAKLGGGHRWGNLWVPSPVPIGVPRLNSRRAFPGCKLGREWAGLAYTTLNTVGGRAFNLSGLRDKLTQHRSWVLSKHSIMSPSCLLDLWSFQVQGVSAMLFSIALTPLLRCAHTCPTALPVEHWLAYLLVRVLLQVAGSRESALKPSQVPPTPCREEGGRLMSLLGSVPFASRPGSDGGEESCLCPWETSSGSEG